MDLFLEKEESIFHPALTHSHYIMYSHAVLSHTVLSHSNTETTR